VPRATLNRVPDATSGYRNSRANGGEYVKRAIGPHRGSRRSSRPRGRVQALRGTRRSRVQPRNRGVKQAPSSSMGSTRSGTMRSTAWRLRGQAPAREALSNRQPLRPLRRRASAAEVGAGADVRAPPPPARRRALDAPRAGSSRWCCSAGCRCCRRRRPVARAELEVRTSVEVVDHRRSCLRLANRLPRGAQCCCTRRLLR
jgi:hypothetical protein